MNTLREGKKWINIRGLSIFRNSSDYVILSKIKKKVAILYGHPRLSSHLPSTFFILIARLFTWKARTMQCFFLHK